MLGQYGLHLLSAPPAWATARANATLPAGGAGAALPLAKQGGAGTALPLAKQGGATASTAAGRLRCLCFEPC